MKSYQSVRALDHVSLQIEPGQIVSLLGPNGAGKTTMLRCLAGIAAPDKGGVYFDEREFRRDQMDLRRRMQLLPDLPFHGEVRFHFIGSVGTILNDDGTCGGAKLRRQE